MNKEQLMVREFHKAFDIQINDKPTLNVDQNVPHLRLGLIQEELNELHVAMKSNSLEGIADALGDLLYVVYGTAVSYGLDMEVIFAEVHRSNMTKVGGWQREDGKWMKPNTYEPPNLSELL